MIGFYAIALPLAIVFVFEMNLGLQGLWLGPVCGVALELGLFLFVMKYLINWDKILIEVV